MTVTCPTPSFALAQFQQCLLKRVTVILTFCSVVYFSLFTTPLHILLSLLLLNLFFCSTCFSSLLLISPMPLIMWSCSLLCSCHFFFFCSYLTSPSSCSFSSMSFLSFFLSSKPFLSLFVLPFWHTMDGLLLYILLFLHLCLCLYLMLSLYLSYISLLFLRLFYLLFCSPFSFTFFSSSSLSLSFPHVLASSLNF